MSPALSELFYVLKEHFIGDPQWRPHPTLLSGRVVIITGANTGLGLETAIQLGRLNPSLIILACRNLEKGEAAKQRVVDQTGLSEGRVEVWELDLARFASVKAFAKRCESSLSRVDVVVQNAGLSTFKWVESEDGWESMVQVNVLATGLLGVLLLPLLAKTAALPLEQGMDPFKPHQTFLSSLAHIFASDPRPTPTATPLLPLLNDPNSPALPLGNPRYNLTKLGSLFLARSLARLPLAAGVVVNCVNPGLCTSEFRREYGGIGRWLLDALAWPAEKGVKNIGFAATEETPGGAYVDSAAVREPSVFAKSDAGMLLEREMWKEMSDEWVKVAPEVKETLA